MANNDKRQAKPEGEAWLKKKYGAVPPKLALLAGQQKVRFSSRPMQRSEDT